MEYEGGFTIVETIVVIAIMSAISLSVLLFFQTGKAALGRDLMMSEAASEALLCDDSFRTVIRNIRIPYWESAYRSWDDIASRVHATRYGDCVAAIDPLSDASGVVYGCRVSYRIGSVYYETVESFSYKGVMRER